MTFSGTLSLAQTDQAAADLGEAATHSADVAESIAALAELIGCAEYAAQCLAEAADAVELCRSMEELLERKREELYLSSIGMESTAISMESVTTAMAVELQRSMVEGVEADEPEYNAENVTSLVEQLKATDPNDQASIDALTAELQIELERKTGDFDVANLAAELVKGGATTDDALAFAESSDDYESRIRVVWDANDPNTLAAAIIPTLDLTNRQDLAVGTGLWTILTKMPSLDLRATEMLVFGDGDLSLEDLGQLAGWVNDHEVSIDVNPAAYELIETLQAGVLLNGQPYADEVEAALLDVRAGGNTDAAIELMMQFGTRDPSVGGIEFDETLLSVIGFTPDFALATYGALMQLQVDQFDGVPDRASLQTILNDVYIAQGLDPITAALQAQEADAAMTGFVENFDMYRELGSVMSPPFEGDDWIDPRMITLYATALTDDGGPVPPVPNALDASIVLTEAERARLIAQNELRQLANFQVEDGDINAYLKQVRGDMEKVAAKSGLTLDELGAQLQAIQEHQSEIFTLIGASDGSTDLLKLETVDDFLQLDAASEVKRADIDVFAAALQARPFLSTEDIDAIDSFSNGEIDGTLSMDDLVGWLPESGLPIAVQDVLLISANAGSIDTGGLDRAVNWTGNISLAVTAIGLATLPFGVSAGGTLMAAGGILDGSVRVGAAIYKSHWLDAAKEGFWLGTDLVDGPISAAAGVVGMAKIAKFDQLYPEMVSQLTREFSADYVDDLLREAQDGLSFSKLAEVVGGIDNLTDDQAEALAALARNLKGQNGRPFDLSVKGVKALNELGAPEIERLVTDWQKLDYEDSWKLYQWTTLNPTRTDFKDAYDKGLRFDPHVGSKQLSRHPYDPDIPRVSRSALGRALEAIGLPRPGPDFHAHHIVAQKNKIAEPARQLLEKYEIGIHNAANGAWLPATRPTAAAHGLPTAAAHENLHNGDYYSEVNRRLQEAERAAIVTFGPDDIEKIRGDLEIELSKIKEEILAGTFP